MASPAADANSFAVVSALRHVVGECPTWDERQQALFWTSIIDGRIYRLDPATGQRQHWQFEAPDIVAELNSGVEFKPPTLPLQPSEGNEAIAA